MCCRTMVVQSYRGNLEKRRRVRTVKCVALCLCFVYFVFRCILFGISLCVLYGVIVHILYCIEMYFIVYFARCVQCFVLCIANKGWAVDKNGQAANDRKATNEERHCMRKI